MVMSRHRDPSGALIGNKHDSPVLDSRVYTIKLPDGYFEEYSTNILAEALSSLINADGYDTYFITKLCGYRNDSSKAIKREDRFFIIKNGNKILKVTIKGWEIQIIWLDNTKTWVILNFFKNS